MKTYKEMMDELHPDPDLVSQTKERMIHSDTRIHRIHPKFRYAILLLTVLLIFLMFQQNDQEKQTLVQLQPQHTQAISNQTAFIPQHVTQLTQHAEQNKSLLYDKNFSLQNFELSSIQYLLQKEENTIYSPFSTNFTMGMLYSGLDGASKDQVEQLLQARQIEVETYLKACFMKYQSEHFLIDNSLWFDEHHNVNQTTLQEIADLYAADSYHINFRDQQEINELNSYIDQKSGHMIQPDYQIDYNLAFKLINVTTLQAKWVNVFRNIGPLEGFYRSDGSTAYPDILTATLPSPAYQKTDQYECVEFALDNGFKFRIILPDASLQLQDLLKDSEQLQHVLYDTLSPTDHKVILRMPAFSITNKWNLNQYLNSQGVTDMFEPNTTDLHLFGDELYLDRVEQIAAIDVNETGVHVAAETVADGKTLGIERIDSFIEMFVNRPFLYTISSSDQQLIYIGTLYDPAE